MAERFHSLDARLERDVRALHDYLWVPGWAGDVDALRADILRDARALDRFLEAGSALSRNAVVLSRHLDAAGESGLLFEFLSLVHLLTAAVERLRTGDLGGATEAAARAAERVSITACSLIQRSDLVEGWQAGAMDFEAYTRSIADGLEPRGFAEAGELKRMLNVAHGIARPGPGPKEARSIAAKAAVASALWCGMAVVRLRKTIGTPAAVPYRDYPRILGKIAARF